MTRAPSEDVVAPDCANLRQGDVVELLRLSVVVDVNGQEELDTPSGVAVLSQTCDVVQPSKKRCLVAPVIEADQTVLENARKGRKPLHLFLRSTSSSAAPRVADMELATSVPKEMLVGLRLISHYSANPSDKDAGKVAARVGRAFGRFPFPGEVYPAFGELRSRAQRRSGTESPFGKVIDLMDDLRVGADQWLAPGRRLTLCVVVPEELLAPTDDYDSSWVWGPERVRGIRPGESPGSLSLHRVCELILENVAGDRTTLANLWIEFGERVQVELLQPALSSEVRAFAVEVLSDSEMTVRRYHETESLDLEVLSDSSWDAGGSTVPPGS